MTITANDVIAKLLSLPDNILSVDMRLTELETLERLDTAMLKELKESLELAEVNAALQCQPSGSNEKARELERRAAIAQSPEVQAAREAVRREELELARKATDKAQAAARKAASVREFDAMLHIAELMAGQMNVNATKSRRKVFSKI